MTEFVSRASLTAPSPCIPQGVVPGIVVQRRPFWIHSCPDWHEVWVLFCQLTPSSMKKGSIFPFVGGSFLPATCPDAIAIEETAGGMVGASVVPSETDVHPDLGKRYLSDRWRSRWLRQRNYQNGKEKWRHLRQMRWLVGSSSGIWCLGKMNR